jgi:DNA-binding response OmpR family regulator
MALFRARVLLVEDDQQSRVALARALAARYEVSEAQDARTALVGVYANPVDVVVSDLHLPDHDGTWLLEALRDSFPAVGRILLSGDDTTPTNACHVRLVKPVSTDELEAAIRRVLSRSSRSVITP